MKKVHTEEQIVGILRGHEASGLSVEGDPRDDVLQLEKAIWDDGCGGGAAIKNAATGERPAQKAVGGASPGDRRDQGSVRKKW